MKQEHDKALVEKQSAIDRLTTANETFRREKEEANKTIQKLENALWRSCANAKEEIIDLYLT